MPGRRHPKRCKVCHGTEAEVGRISARGYCITHGRTREWENIEQLEAHAGPWFDHWRKRCLASFGVLEA